MIGAYAVNRLGTWLGTVALSLAVYDHTHSALAVAALLFAGQALPAFVVPALIARLEERAGQAVHNANAALNLAFTITFVLGPVLGGALVAGAGAPAALFIDAGSFLVCGALLSDVHPHVEEAAADTVRARLRAALTHITNAPALRTLLIADAVALVFFAAAGPVEVAYAKTTLLAGDRGYGLPLAGWGAGAVLGGLVCARLVRHPLRGALATIGAGTVGAAIALLYASKRGREAVGDAVEYRAERQTTEQLDQAARQEHAARG